MQIEIASQALRRALTNNSTTASFTAKIPTQTKPSEGSGLFKIAGEGHTRQRIKALPFGTDTNDQTMKFRVWGWNEARQSNGMWYIPMLLAEVNVTLGNIAAGFAADTFFADTLALGTGINADFVDVNASTSDEVAFAIIETQGCQWIEFDFDRDSSAASCNALFSMF